MNQVDGVWEEGVGGNYREIQPTIAAHSVFVVTNEYSALTLLLLVVAAVFICLCLICCICCCCYCRKYKKLKNGNVTEPIKGGKGSPTKGGAKSPAGKGPAGKAPPPKRK